MKNFEETSFSTHVKNIEAIIGNFENRFGDFKEIEEDISLFTQPLTVSIENIRSDQQLELCHLQSNPFYTTEVIKKIFLNYYQ